MPTSILMMVTDRQRLGDGEQALERLVANAGRAARAGVDLIQVRERGLDDRRLLALVKRIIAVAAGTGARVVVNERTDIALVAKAAGVHLRSSSPPAARVRTIVPRGFLVGRSIHSPEEAVAAERDGGCDYLVFGTVFASPSKPSGHPVAGLAALGRVAASVALPVVAIGGLNDARAGEAASAGAAGVAAIELFARDSDDNDVPLREVLARIRAAFGVHGWT